MKKYSALFVGILIALSGCSTTIPVNYVPSPSIKGSGSVSTGQFIYLPAVENQVAHNQFQKAVSLGQMYLSERVDELIKTSLRKELIAAGFDVDNDEGVVISGEINKFLYDWTGFIETDMYLDINYIVKKQDTVLFEGVIKSHKALPKTIGYDSEAVRSTISDNIGQLLMELRVRKII